MSMTKKYKVALVMIMILAMIFNVTQMAFAAGTKVEFPIMALNGTDMVADKDTSYVVVFDQDPATKMITATVVVKNGAAGTGAKPVVLNGVGVQVTFSSNIAPYAYNPTDPSDTHPFDEERLFKGGPDDDIPTFKKYCYAPTEGFDTIGSPAVQNDSNGRFLGAKISTVKDSTTISLNPGESVVIAHLFFMPVNGKDILNLDMFSFQWSAYTSKMIKLSTWIANGTRFVVSNAKYPTSSAVYVLSPGMFKLHVAQGKPNVSVNNEDRTINGYDPGTMEWAYDESGPYQVGAPAVKDEAHTIYVRQKGTEYSGNDPEYGNYKKYLAGEPAAVEFNRNFISCGENVSLSKTGVNLTGTDGNTRVNDVIRYTIIAKNSGDPRSVWAGAVLTDTLPGGVTFAGNATLDGGALEAGTGYTFSNGTLTVPLGDIPGGTQKTVTFEVTVNADAYGMQIKNSASVNGNDGEGGADLDKETEEGGGGKTVVEKSDPPTIGEITVGDKEITGTGEPGAEITVTLEDGTKIETTVDENGNWKVDLPDDKEVGEGDTITVVQTEEGKDPSDETQVTAENRPDPIRVSLKTSANLSGTAEARRVGDIIEYTIIVKNEGAPKSLWTNVIIEDTLPTEVTYVNGSVAIDGAAAGAAAGYSDGILTAYLGDISGGVKKVVTFRAEINETAYGKIFKNTAVVDGVDVEEGIDPPPVAGRSPTPSVDEINDGDRVITGTGEPGATIVIDFPPSTIKGTATVGEDGTWSVTVPGSVNLEEGAKVTVVQTVEGSNPSLPEEVIVQAKKNVIPFMSKASENLTGSDGNTRVNDTLRYTITVRNDGSSKSIWTNTIMTDVIPAGLTLKTETVLLDGKVPTYFYYDSANRTLLVSIDGGITGGQTRVITFETTVNSDAFGLTIKNAASVDGKENGSGGADISENTEEGGGGNTVIDKSNPPTIDDIDRGDETITGTGEPGAGIVVTLEDGTKIETTVDGNGNWTVEVPPDKKPDTGDTVTVTQVEQGKDPSDETTITVKDKNYRAVRGLVWLMLDDDLGLGADFLKKHDIIVELRPTFQTAAASGLSTKSILAAGSERAGLGEFTIENVPFGTYVLCIMRPGFLTRTMVVTVSASDPDMITLAPPGTEDAGVFNLWWGDSNDDLRIDNEDIMMILELMNIGVNANHHMYNAACDMNGDGRCDNEDIMMVLERWNLNAGQYAGAEKTDFFD